MSDDTLRERTQVGIVGAGPAGLMLSHLLATSGIDSVVVDHRSRTEIEHTHRAGILEQDSVRLLTESGVSDRVHRDGHRHTGIELRFDGAGHRIDFEALVGASVWLYPQTDVFVDLADARARDGGDVRFAVTDTAVDGVTDRPVLRFTDGDGRRSRGGVRLPRRCRRLPQLLPVCGSRARAAARLHRVPVRLVRHPGGGAGQRAGAGLHAVRPRLRPHLAAHRHGPADVLPVRPRRRGGRLVRRPHLGRAAVPGGRRRLPAPGGPGPGADGAAVPQCRRRADALRQPAPRRGRRAYRPSHRRQGPEPRAAGRQGPARGARRRRRPAAGPTPWTSTGRGRHGGSGGPSSSPTG